MLSTEKSVLRYYVWRSGHNYKYYATSRLSHSKYSNKTVSDFSNKVGRIKL